VGGMVDVTNRARVAQNRIYAETHVEQTQSTPKTFENAYFVVEKQVKVWTNL
jgi:hypothetical protein